MRHRSSSAIRAGHSLSIPPVLAVLAALLASGCDALSPLLPDVAAMNESLLSAIRATDPAAAPGEPDAAGDFAQALELPIEPAGQTNVTGTISGDADVDVYRFGPLAAGDTLVLEVEGGGLDTRAALFDNEGAVLQANDDRNYYGGQRDPRIQTTLRHDLPFGYAAVAGKPAAFNLFGTNSASGPYVLRLSRAPGTPPPPPVQPQIVWIELGGATGVRIAGEAPQDVPPFQAEKISPRLGLDRARILDRAIELMQADYADYRVEFLRSDRHTRPRQPHTVLFFGGFSNQFLGLADNVDWYNSQQTQEAIIYTDTLGLFESLLPNWEQAAQAVANVAAHELGHLLGLDHTAMSRSVMSEAASAQQVFMLDAELIAAPLNPRVFPIGLQNAPLKLALGAGLRDAQLTLETFIEAHPISPDVAALAASPRSRRALADREAAADVVSLPLEAFGVRMCNHDR